MSYDFIILGGGSAGATLAARLSEDPARQVMLIEAGPHYSSVDSLPDDIKDGDNVMKAALTGEHFWTYTARANQFASKPLVIMAGKVTGGGSAVNATFFLRGIPEDYDRWAEMGNDEWAFTKVLPYFRKLETDLDHGGDFHGQDGPIPVRRAPREAWSPLRHAFYDACRTMGFPDDPDVNHPGTSGVGTRPLNSKGGVRMSSALAYLNPCQHRPNLTIKPNTTVLRVLFNGRQAIGVEAVHNGEQLRVFGGEIVLCAGAIESPALLVRSGIGPAEHVRMLGIPLVLDAPGVGENLRNHPAVAVRFPLNQEFRERSVPSHLILRYTATGSHRRNDMSITPLVEEVWDDGVYLPFYAVLWGGRSVGKLTVVSPDPDVQPVLNYRYLTDLWDFERLREGVRFAARLGREPAFTRIFHEGMYPNEEVLASDARLDPWILGNLETTYHSSGTCKMGPPSDPMAVVDQYGRVRGLDNLRIVDASIMPDLVRADTTATVVMIAERIADWIRDQ